jgi:serine kinase of HPr protein (carbohydrate metabolism regulator)
MQKQQKHVTVQRLVNEFGFEIRFQGNIKNKIFLPNLNRTGIELASGKVFDAIYNVVL